MLKIAFILGAAAVGANALFIWYAMKKKHNKGSGKSQTNTEGFYTASRGFLNTEEGKKLKQSAATELGISVEELDNMTVDEITELARINELI